MKALWASLTGKRGGCRLGSQCRFSQDDPSGGDTAAPAQAPAASQGEAWGGGHGSSCRRPPPPPPPPPGSVADPVLIGSWFCAQ